MAFKPVKMSARTRANWLIDAAVFSGAVVAVLSGIYFLFYPSGGYQGGRNALYGVTVLFERHTWSDLHTWGGVLMIAAVVVHLIIHWKWIKSMTRRVIPTLCTGSSSLSRGARVNVIVDVVIAICFVVTAVSGLYFLFTPAGGIHTSTVTTFLFSGATWDVIHTWSGVVLIAAALVHFYIHWGWIRKVTARFFLSLLPESAQSKLQTTL
jgi:hypothetical protein